MKERDVIKTEPRPLIRDLDELPFPARHLMNLNLYGDVGDFFFNTMKGSKLDGEKLTKFKKSFIMSSRGCPFSCQFCSTSVFLGT